MSNPNKQAIPTSHKTMHDIELLDITQGEIDTARRAVEREAPDLLEALGLVGYEGHDTRRNVGRAKPVWRDPMEPTVAAQEAPR